MQLVKTLSVVALATGAVVAMPAHVQKRQWTGINRWWQRPSSDAVITVTGYAPQPTDWNAAASSTSTTVSSTTVATTTSTVEVAVSATPTYGGNFYNRPSASEAAPTTEAPSAPAQTWAPAAPSPTATEAPSSGGASGGVGDYMSVVSKWRAAGIEETKVAMEQIIESACSVEYAMLLRRRLALRHVDPSDQRTLFQPLLDMMETQGLDFHGTFRKLAFFRPGMLKGDGIDGAGALEAFIAGLLSGTPEPERLDSGKATEEWLAWLDTYAARIESERKTGEWAEEVDFDEARKKAGLSANPRFVLRQWLLEEVIKKVELDPETGKHILAKVMKMACSPFESWGREGDAQEKELSEEEQEERRFCGLGDRRMLGFQCSCSS